MIKIENKFFSYDENENSNKLKNINLNIKEGEVILLCGESGCGKTTITRFINGLIPTFFQGKEEGNVFLNEFNLSEIPIYELAENVGSVFQNPKTQFFNIDTTSELIFGCENLAFTPEKIQKELERVIQEFNLKHLLDKSIFKLSGGEKQKIACASVSAVYPDIIVLDEPSSNLDSRSTWNLRNIINHWKNQGKTIIIAEHRLYFLDDVIDKVIFLKNGEILNEWDIHQFRNKNLQELGLRELNLNHLKPNQNIDSSKNTQFLQLKNFNFSYDDKIAIDIDNIDIPQNEIIAIIGKNGAGKSTFARCLCGLESKCKGTLDFNGKLLNSKDRIKISYMVMQDVNHQLFTENVLEEVLLSMNNINILKNNKNKSNTQLSIEEKNEIAKTILKNLDLLHLQDTHPMALSGGEKQRVAIASAIASNKEIIIFDEPTSGLDLKHMKEVASNIKNLKSEGMTSFIVSHDLELILECCNYVIHFEDGKIVDNYYIDEEGENKLKNFFIINDS